MITRKIDETILRCNGGQVTIMQMWIIGFLDMNEGKEIFQKDIEAEFNIRRSTATGILQLMEKNGFITRQPVGRDARLKKVVLTPQAKDLALRVKQRMQHADAELAKGLSQEELDTFFAIIDKIKKNAE
jgi:MarR family transcriptional regulator, repressor for mepA